MRKKFQATEINLSLQEKKKNTLNRSERVNELCVFTSEQRIT